MGSAIASVLIFYQNEYEFIVLAMAAEEASPEVID